MAAFLNWQTKFNQMVKNLCELYVLPGEWYFQFQFPFSALKKNALPCEQHN